LGDELEDLRLAPRHAMRVQWQSLVWGDGCVLDVWKYPTHHQWRQPDVAGSDRNP
jgi:hypothetical protein